MKIGIDIRTLMDKQYSGVSEYTLNLVREILKQDKVNEYKLFYNSGRDVSKRLPKFSQKNVEVVNTRYPNKIFNWPMQKILGWPRVDKMLGVDIFYSPNVSPIALSPNCKKVVTIHDLSFLRYPEFFNFKRRWWHRLINVKKLINKFDVIVAVSENTKNDIIDLLEVPDKKVRVVYSGVGEEFRMLNDPLRPHSEASELRLPRSSRCKAGQAVRGRGMTNEAKEVIKKCNLPRDFILFLGTLEPRKNVAGLIEAYNVFRDKNKDLSDIKLVVAGGKGWKSRDTISSWKKSRYKDDINFLGYVEQKEKVYLYNLARVFVYPSFYEGFGFPPLEALACGTPTVTSFSSSLGEVVGDAALTINPYNVNEMSEAIKQIITDKKLRDSLKEKGLAQAQKFRWQNTAKKYLEIFHSLTL